MKKLGGNADVFENKGVAKKGVRKLMKMRGMQIDGLEGAIRKLLKTQEGRKWVARGGWRVVRAGERRSELARRGAGSRNACGGEARKGVRWLARYFIVHYTIWLAVVKRIFVPGRVNSFV